MMIEADVSLGFDLEGSLTEMVPIMAHPPILVSDLSLDRFLETIVKVSIKQLPQISHFCKSSDKKVQK